MYDDAGTRKQKSCRSFQKCSDFDPEITHSPVGYDVSTWYTVLCRNLWFPATARRVTPNDQTPRGSTEFIYYLSWRQRESWQRQVKSASFTSCWNALQRLRRGKCRGDKRPCTWIDHCTLSINIGLQSRAGFVGFYRFSLPDEGHNAHSLTTEERERERGREREREWRRIPLNCSN